MRSLITSPQIMGLLDEIEGRLPGPILAIPFRRGEGAGYHAQIDFYPRPVFRYHHDGDITDYVLAHELMHVKLKLEGWPILELSPLVQDRLVPDLRHLAQIVMDTIEHVQIAADLKCLKLYDSNPHLAAANKILSELERDPEAVAKNYRVDASIPTTLQLFPLLLPPYPQSAGKLCEQTCRKNKFLQRSLREAMRIRALFGEPAKVKPTTALRLAQDAFFEAGVPREVLQSAPAYIPV